MRWTWEKGKHCGRLLRLVLKAEVIWKVNTPAFLQEYLSNFVLGGGTWRSSVSGVTDRKTVVTLDCNYFHGHRSTVMNMNTNSVWKNRMGTSDFVRVVTLQINHCCVHHNDSINYANRLITYETSLNSSVAMWSAHSWTILVWLQFRSGLGFDLLSCAIVIT